MKYLLLILALSAQAAVDFEVNSESGNDVQNLFYTTSRVRSYFTDYKKMQPFLAQGVEYLDPNRSFIYAGPGVRYLLHPKVQATAELRGRYFYLPNRDPQDNLEIRASMLYQNYWDQLSWVSKSQRDFIETSTETVFSSGDKGGNAILSLSIHAGLRTVLSYKTFLDFYVDPFITVDSVGHFYNNRWDFKYSARFLKQWGNVQVGAVASVFYNQYLPYAKGTNPYASDNLGFKANLFIKGTF